MCEMKGITDNKRQRVKCFFIVLTQSPLTHTSSIKPNPNPDVRSDPLFLGINCIVNPLLLLANFTVCKLQPRGKAGAFNGSSKSSTSERYRRDRFSIGVMIFKMSQISLMFHCLTVFQFHEYI